jgi:hypothetical protein
MCGRTELADWPVTFPHPQGADLYAGLYGAGQC